MAELLILLIYYLLIYVCKYLLLQYVSIEREVSWLLSANKWIHLILNYYKTGHVKHKYIVFWLYLKKNIVGYWYLDVQEPFSGR